MPQTARERVLAAVDLNPNRSRVTIRREDARQLAVADGRSSTLEAENATLRTLITECRTKLCELREERDDAKAALSQVGAVLVETTSALDEAGEHVETLAGRLDVAAAKIGAMGAQPTWFEMAMAILAMPVVAYAGWCLHSTSAIGHHG